MKSIITAVFILIIVSTVMSCKKTYPTTVINNDTTIIIRTDTVIINNNDTTIYQGDAQVRFTLPTFGTSDSSFTTDSSYSIRKFNIGYYPRADSVIWACTVSGLTNDGSASSPVTLQLYNLTDNVAVTGSSIQSAVNYQFTYSTSGNCLAGFPAKEINLGIRLSGNRQDVQGVNVYNAYLYIYQK